MSYIDGFVLVVPKNKFKEYKKLASEAGKVWKKYGALEYFECIGDDLNPKMVQLPFPKLTKLKSNEAVWFSFIIYKSKAHRNAVNFKVMKYFEKKYKDPECKDMPFDMKRMAYGGFKAVVKY